MNDFPDDTEYIEQPMDLGTVRGKLEKKNYLAPENFAQDVRRVRILIFFNRTFCNFQMQLTQLFRSTLNLPQVWQNCKVHNQHGSAIWYVADYLSKQFEHLHHAWVLAF